MRHNLNDPRSVQSVVFLRHIWGDDPTGGARISHRCWAVLSLLLAVCWVCGIRHNVVPVVLGLPFRVLRLHSRGLPNHRCCRGVNPVKVVLVLWVLLFLLLPGLWRGREWLVRLGISGMAVLVVGVGGGRWPVVIVERGTIIVGCVGWVVGKA